MHLMSNHTKPHKLYLNQGIDRHITGNSPQPLSQRLPPADRLIDSVTSNVRGLIRRSDVTAS